MSEVRSVRIQLAALSAVLLTIMALLMVGKLADGMPLTPGQRDVVWQIEARVSFEADEEHDGLRVALAVPDNSLGFRFLDEQAAASGYGASFMYENDARRVIWTRREATSRQLLFYRAEVFDIEGAAHRFADERPTVTAPVWVEPQATAVRSLIDSARSRSSTNASFVRELIKAAQSKQHSGDMDLLMGDTRSSKERVEVAARVFATAGIPARSALGLVLKEGHGQEALPLVEVHTGTRWQFFDMSKGQAGLPENTIIWRRNGTSLLDLQGGHGARVRFDLLRRSLPAEYLAKERADGVQDNSGGGLSLYDLPLAQQNTFKMLLLIPIAALVVALARNVVGIKTSGTFMPVLIALAFRETTLLSGWIIFSTIIFAGVLLRGWLTSLNLLLVPRIAAVVVMVVFLMMGYSVVSYRLGFTDGLGVTVFPMIIIAWTIERLSVAAEEQGSREALVQTAGSLIVASVCYLIMSSSWVEHLVFNFPESNLVVLVAILWVGIYTGFRLTELRRFEPLVREDQDRC